LNGIRGVIVGNALPELLSLANNDSRFFLSRATEADGVIEGLHNWGLHAGQRSSGNNS